MCVRVFSTGMVLHRKSNEKLHLKHIRTFDSNQSRKLLCTHILSKVALAIQQQQKKRNNKKIGIRSANAQIIYSF